MRKLSRFARLSAAERWLLIRAAFLVISVRLGLWLLPFRTLRRLLERAFRAPTGAPGVGGPEARRIAWAVAVVSEHVPHATCLTQALAAQALLRRHGWAAELRIGVVRGGDGQIEAHAWVVSQGVIVIGGSAASVARYAPFPLLESKQA